MGDADTRERLLRAAIATIATDGERAIRVRDIAAQAGVTEPSLYHFFGSREGLIIAAQTARFREDQLEGLARFREAVQACTTFEEFVAAVRATLQWAYGSERHGARSTRIDVLGSAQSRPELARELVAAQRGVNVALGDSLRLAQTRGWVRPDVDCTILAAWVATQILGRAFLEIDAELATSTEWNEISIAATLAACTGVVINPPNNERPANAHTDL